MKTLLTLTFSGSALALLLLALRYFLLRRMPSTVYYYAWLLVLLRFALPLPGLIPTERPAAVNDAPVITAQPLSRVETPTMQFITAPAESIRPAVDAVAVPEPREELPVQTGRQDKSTISFKSPTLWTAVWGIGVAISITTTVVSYKVFSRRVRRSLKPATAEDRRVYRMLPGRKPKLCRCAAFRTPLMFGVFRPLITLPDQAYDEETLANILRHELLHYRRRDTLYKWFAVAVLSTQWFNPLSYLIRRELNRACELSCDEMLLRDMDRADKLSYGNTLINMASAGALSDAVVATTFSTEKKNLKERLEQIMHYKKSGTRLLAAVLALVLLAGCAALAGPLPHAAAEDRAGNVVKVLTVDELLAAIAPDTVIELEAGTYDLTTASDYGQDTHSAYYSWNGAYDGFELVLQNMRNLTIRGAGMGETTLAAVPRYANVLRFYGCQGINVEALTAGHTTEPGFCMGGVLSFESCEGITVDTCGLYGCGTIGVQARECNDLTVKSTEIYECSYGAVSLHSCRDVTLTDCDIHDHGTRAGQGDAMFLFDFNYSEDVAVYKNRIHDNRAQYMLMGDYARRVLFLTNEVRGNSFVSSVFQFRQYGATVDGCVFEGNDVRGGWYQGDVYAGDIDGNLLEGALLAEMTHRDIDPATASPLASVGNPTEVPKGGSITVSTVDDFLAAIGPDRTIILDGALFDLSTASNYGGIGTDCYYWAENYDGPQLVIHDVNGLSIQAKDSSSGATTLAAIPRYADVLSFRNCDNLFLGGFTAGHTKEPGVCSGGVLNFQNCNGVTLEKMRLYGCGILGIQTSQCSSLDILRTEIYECSQGAGMFFQTDGINFSDCNIYDVPSPALSFRECGDKTWNGEPVNGLNGRYDVNADGTLYTVLTEDGPSGEESEFHGGVEEVENPFAEEPTLSFEKGTPQEAFASSIQQAIANDDWEALADRIFFPLQFFTDHHSFMIHDREEYLKMAQDGYFTNELFTDTFRFRERIANADPTVFASCIFGNTCLDHMIAFACTGNKLTEDNLKINAISVKTPLWPGRAPEPAYVQAVPPTPMLSSETEGIRVLFFATEIKTDFTLWPDDPIELNARISPELAAGTEFEWKTDNPSVLRAEKTGPDTANITCIDDGTLPQTCKLTVSCAGLQKELTVYCRPK